MDVKPKKLVFLSAGGSAAGKSTTTKEYVIGEPDEHVGKFIVDTRKGPAEMSVCWTLYENCAVCGNHHSGSDANQGPGPIRASFHQCLPLRDVIIVDGKINSPQWVTMVNDVADDYDIRIVTLYFNLQPETLLERLAKRRGVEIESIRESMYDKCVEATGRADLLVRNVKKLAKVPYDIFEIDDEDSTEDIVDVMDVYTDQFLGISL